MIITLNQLINILTKVPGAGHPAVFITPDNKRWQVRKVVGTQVFDGQAEDLLQTEIHLVKLDDPK